MMKKKLDLIDIKKFKKSKKKLVNFYNTSPIPQNVFGGDLVVVYQDTNYRLKRSQ